ncbi:FadR/GntR family transcriptional regulator [Salinibacterium sp. NK8237]|uniref:FadR/GntR family transcriptional regulator n=1 Tax=Salinibacterium sp. NK8237 TaxID=2792038 RepID=UPI0018CDE502|nr:FadR/GntR family transcriptional regulator [Salinibacterium sp. NK8237]MBH0130409.1 FadR family transcriptional regulator [Salinibacterium sp. NK8237]
MDLVSADDAAPKWLANGEVGRAPAARLGVAVVREIVDSIVTEQVPAGTTLPPEGTLSSHFGVSRTVIRESVKRVEEKGLVTVAQGRGTTVNPASSWNMLDPVVLSSLVDNDDTLGVLDELAVVRGSLEASMAGAAATRRTDDDLAALRALTQRMETSLGDAEENNQADAEFHHRVMEQSGIRLAANITGILFDRALSSTRFVGAPADEDSLRVTLAEHVAVLDAIERADSKAASEAMATHISRAWLRRRPTAS